MPIRLVFRSLFQHPVRTLLTVASLTVALFLLCLLRTLVVTLDAGVKEARSDRIIVQSAVSLFVELPESYTGKIAQVPGVESICSWNWFGGVYKDRENFFAQFAVNADTLVPMYPEMVIDEGSEQAFKANRTACLVGVTIAEKYGFKVGDRVPIIGRIYARKDGSPWEFEVAGIYHSTKSSLDESTLFFHYDYLREALEQGDATGPTGVGLYVVEVAEDHPPVQVMAAIDELFENGPQRVQSTSEAEFQAQFVSMAGNVPFFVACIGGGVFFAILLAVINTMLMAAREQTRAVGILKALGFTNGTASMMMLFQSLLIAGLGGGAGVFLALASSEGIQSGLGTMFPNYHVSNETVGLGIAATVLVGLVAGVMPAIRMARLRPVASLRAEN